MKSLIAPAFAVLASTAGTAAGCHAFGMPPSEVKLAAALAFTLALLAAGSAVALASRPRRRARPTLS